MTSPIDEICLSACIIIFFVIILKGDRTSDSTFKIYGYVVVGILALSIVRTMIYTIYCQVDNLVKTMKEKCKRKVKVKTTRIKKAKKAKLKIMVQSS